MIDDLSPDARFWLESVLARLGMPEWQRQACAAAARVELEGVSIEFLHPPSGQKDCVVARALVGEVPPPGRCEAFYQLVLQVQGMLWGAHTPALGLGWPARMLQVSASLATSSVSFEDAAMVLCSIRQMALHWRVAIAQAGDAAAQAADRPASRAAPLGEFAGVAC